MTALFASRLPITKIPAANWSRQYGPQRKLWIVLHAMQYHEKGDSAEWCGNFFAGRLPDGKGGFLPPPRSSANFSIDSNSIVEHVPAELVAWHAPGANQLGIGLEHAGFVRQTAAQWLDAYGKSMLSLSSRLCAELCEHFSIPCVYVDAAGLRSRQPGITTHEQCTKAWPEKGGTHTDPGPGFPLQWYVGEVRKHLNGASLEA